MLKTENLCRKKKKSCKFMQDFGRGSRTWTHDQRFWSGSKIPKPLENTGFLQHLSEHQNPKCCALMLFWCYEPNLLHYIPTAFLMLLKIKGWCCNPQHQPFDDLYPTFDALLQALMLCTHFENHNFPLGAAILTLNHTFVKCQYLIRYNQRRFL